MLSQLDELVQDPLISLNTHQKCKTSLKIQKLKLEVLPQVFLTLPVQSKTTLTVFTFLIRCHKYYSNLDWQSLDVMMSFWWIPVCFKHSPEDKWMSVHELPYLGTLCFHIVSERLFAWLTSPVTVKTRLESTSSSISRQENNEQGDCPHHDPGYWHGVGEGEPGDGNHLLPLWPGRRWSLSDTLFDLSPAGLTWAGCSGGEDLYQLMPCSPTRGLLASPTLDGSYPLSGCYNCPISTCPAVPVQTTPELLHTGHPAWREGKGNRLKVIPFIKKTFHGRAPTEGHHLFLLCASLSLHNLSPTTPTGTIELTDQGSTQLQPVALM